MDLNNREFAVLIWICALFVFSMLHSNIRVSLISVARTLIQPAIIRTLVLVAIWISISIAGLRYIEIWQWGNFKTTIIWTITFALVATFDVIQTNEHKTFFKQTLKDTISAAAIVTFISESYSFGLFLELLLFPLAIIVALIKGVADRSMKHQLASTLSNWVLILIGVAYFGNGLYLAIQNATDYATRQNFIEFILPITLTLLFLPFLYLIHIYSVYESIFIRINYALKDKKLRRYAKFQAIKQFGNDNSSLLTWTRDIIQSPPSTPEDIRASVDDIKERSKREFSPPTIPKEEGWSPYLAKNILQNLGITTGDYHPSSDGEWFANSNLIELEHDELLQNNIFYCVEGNKYAANRLKLTLNVNNISTSKTAEHSFRKAASALLQYAIGKHIKSIQEKMISGELIDENLGIWHISFFRENFSGGIKDGYRLKLVVKLN